MPIPNPISDIQTIPRFTGVLCDIDDTLTLHGRLVPEAFTALSRLQSAGLRVVPITGRPGGWVDQIARLWPMLTHPTDPGKTRQATVHTRTPRGAH